MGVINDSLLLAKAGISSVITHNTHLSGGFFSNRGQPYVEVRLNMHYMAGSYDQVAYLVVVNSTQRGYIQALTGVTNRCDDTTQGSVPKAASGFRFRTPQHKVG